MSAMQGERRFLADWSAIWRVCFFTLSFPLQAIIQCFAENEVSWRVLGGSLISWGLTCLIIVPGAALAMSVRASPAGIRPLFRDLIPWTSIVAASRQGTMLHYEATIGLNGAAVSESLRVSRGLAAAVREWLKPDHPVVTALNPDVAAPERPYWKRRSDPIADGTTLRTNRAVQHVFWICLPFFAAVGYASFLTFEGRVAVAFACFWGAWVLLCTLGLLDCWITRGELQRERFTVRSLFNGSQSAAWSDVASIGHSLAWGGWITIRSENGNPIRVGHQVDGVSALAHALLQRCPSAEISPATRDVLERLALGEQRPIWGLQR